MNGRNKSRVMFDHSTTNALWQKQERKVGGAFTEIYLVVLRIVDGQKVMA